MTRLGYLLPFLWALGYGTTLDPKATIATTSPTTTISTQMTTAVNSVTTAASKSSPTVASSTDAATTTITTSIPKLSVSPETTKLDKLTSPATPKLTTSNNQQERTQPTTAKPDSTSAELKSTSKPSITETTPTVTNTNDNSAQTRASPTGSTQALINSTVVEAGWTTPLSTMANTKNLTEQVSATSAAFLTTPQPSNVTNTREAKLSVSTVSRSPVTISTNPSSSIFHSTTSLPVKTMPSRTTTPMIPNQKTIDNIEINCTAKHDASHLKIHMKSSSICGTHASTADVKKIMNDICTALKPGYLPNKDKCHIDLGTGLPDELVIVNAYVQSSLNLSDLYASLKHIKKDQDGSSLFTYDGAKYEEEDLVSIPLISAIVALAVALLIAAAIYGCWHQRQTRKREQRLTEELQTMENGYHDNPTLEVMETSPEMQEKKGGPNGELGDSWIVPLDNLTREDFDDEEDTHL